MRNIPRIGRRSLLGAAAGLPLGVANKVFFGVDGRADGLEVGAGGELGDDTAVRRVERDLRGDDRADDLAAVAEHRGRGLVAAGLDGEEVQDS